MSDRSNHHLGLISVGIMAASHRLRRACGIGALIILLLGLVLFGLACFSQYMHPGNRDAGSAGFVGLGFAVFGAFSLLLWTLATFFAFIGRIAGEDVGLLAPVRREPRLVATDGNPGLMLHRLGGWVLTAFVILVFVAFVT